MESGEKCEGREMSKFKHDVIVRGIKVLNVILITIPLSVCWGQYYLPCIENTIYKKRYFFIIVIYCVLYVVFGRLYDAFAISIYKVGEIVYSQFLAQIMSNCLFYFIIWILAKGTLSVIPMIVVQTIQIVESILWTYVSHRLYFYIFKSQKMIIVYDQYQENGKLISEHGLEEKYEIYFLMSVEECLGKIEKLKEADTVFMSGIHSHERNIILKYCVLNSIDVLVMPRIGDVIMSGAYPMHVFHKPILKVERDQRKPEYIVLKRVLDIIISLTMLIIFSPFMLITSICIKCEDNGPVLYKQTRLTKDGKKFKILKFRSMKVDAEKDGIARLSTGEKDDRITGTGRVIRRFRIDELPQLINILKGDLSICGPRPERPEIAEEYCKEIPEFALRLQVKAGLTGYAQVYGKYNSTPYDKLQMDLMYIAHHSIFEDLKIMLATVKIIFLAESTEGIEAGTDTAMIVRKDTREEKIY